MTNVAADKEANVTFTLSLTIFGDAFRLVYICFDNMPVSFGFPSACQVDIL